MGDVKTGETFTQKVPVSNGDDKLIEESAKSLSNGTENIVSDENEATESIDKPTEESKNALVETKKVPGTAIRGGKRRSTRSSRSSSADVKEEVPKIEPMEVATDVKDVDLSPEMMFELGTSEPFTSFDSKDIDEANRKMNEFHKAIERLDPDKIEFKELFGDVQAATPGRSSRVSKPEFKKPFEYGWVREVVYRNPDSKAPKNHADIYYHSPIGKKFRSARELADHITEGLSLENFTFFKEPIGMNDPAKEIVRYSKSVKPNATTPIKIEDKIVLSPKRNATPKVVTPVSKPKSKDKSPSTPKSSTVDKKSPTSSKATAKATTPKTSPVSVKSKASPPEKKRKVEESETKSEDPRNRRDPGASPAPMLPEACSILCPLAPGTLPSLQCTTCLCLFHPVCSGISDFSHFPNIRNFKCKACQSGAVTSSGTLAVVPPLAPIAGKTPAGRSPIVGAVIPWINPSSSIQVSQQPSISTPSPASTGATIAIEAPPQTLVSIGGKHFIVIPKQNVVNQVEGGCSSQSYLVTNSSGSVPSPAPAPAGVFLVPYSVSQDPGQPPPLLVMNNQKLVSNQTTEQSNGLKRKNESESPTGPEKKAKTSSTVADNPGAAAPSPHPVVKNFMMSMGAAYDALLHSFKYLKVHELLRASCVCKMWSHIASHRSLWTTVRMKNSRVRDWEGFGRALRQYGTRTLDLKKMLLPDTVEGNQEMWDKLLKVVAELPTLKRMDLGRCPPDAVEAVSKACPQLEGIIAVQIRGSELDVSCLSNCKQLTELRLKSVNGFDIKGLTELKQLQGLKHLSLTSVKHLEGIEDVLMAVNLVSLELGDCTGLTETMASKALAKQTSLRKLRLEKGQGSCPIAALLNTISTLPHLTTLELINFDVKPGFDKALAKCSSVRTLLIIPTYVTQSATTNHVVMGGVSKLASTLNYFVWGLTLELLRVTDLFIDQVEGQKNKAGGAPTGAKKGAGDSIPILKPLGEESEGTGKEGQSTSQVDILPLPKLQKVLSTLLPTTKIKILKVPFSATWRQTVND